MVRETLEKMNRNTLVTSQALYNIFPIMKITRQGARCIFTYKHEGIVHK